MRPYYRKSEVCKGDGRKCLVCKCVITGEVRSVYMSDYKKGMSVKVIAGNVRFVKVSVITGKMNAINLF